MELATFVNVVLVFVPNELIATRHTTIIKASITAYSTAVGPSSDVRKRCIFLAMCIIRTSLLLDFVSAGGTAQVEM